MIDPPEVIARRLKALRKALNYKTQAKFAKDIGLERNVYNPFERAKRELTFEAACLIRKRFGVPLDWLFFGEAAQLPGPIYDKIEREQKRAAA